MKIFKQIKIFEQKKFTHFEQKKAILSGQKRQIKKTSSTKNHFKSLFKYFQYNSAHLILNLI